MSFKSSRKSRRHRNPHQQTEAEQTGAFFQPLQRKEEPAAIQPKVKIGAPDDKYEREADQVAEHVVAAETGPLATSPAQIQTMPDSRMEEDKAIQEKRIQRQAEEEEPVQMQTEEEEPVQMMEEEEVQAKFEEEEPVQAQEEEEAAQMQPEEEEPVQMQAEEEEPVQMMEEEEAVQAQEEEEPVQMKSAANAPRTASRNLEQKLSSRAGKGNPIQGPVKQQMERGFGRDFSGVNIHTDAEAESMNQELGARAFTRGSDIYFNAGQYNPDTRDGQRLLAHELTHTVQQGAVKGKRGNTNSIQRDAEYNAAGNPTGNYIFRNNTFFRRVRGLVAAGPLTDEQLIELKQDAIRRNGTVQHAELLLMAAALDTANVSLMRAHRSGNFILPLSSISATNRRRVQNVDRGALSEEVRNARTARDATTEGSDARTEAEGDLDSTAYQQIEQEFTGSSFAERAMMELTTQSDVPLDMVLEAMLNAASDSTAGDKLMAGVAYIVARRASHPMAEQIRSGALQVDALIPRVYRRIAGAGGASYQYSTDQDVRKSDTIYLPTNLSVDNIMAQALIVHELTHAADDFSQTGRRQEPEIDLEMRAYTAQSQYILDQFLLALPLAGSENLASASGLAKSGKAHYWGYIKAAKSNRSHYENVLKYILQAPPLSKSEADINTDLNKSVAEIDAELRAGVLAITDRRGNPLYSGTSQTNLDGPAGQFNH